MLKTVLHLVINNENCYILKYIRLKIRHYKIIAWNFSHFKVGEVSRDFNFLRKNYCILHNSVHSDFKVLVFNVLNTSDKVKNRVSKLFALHSWHGKN